MSRCVDGWKLKQDWVERWMCWWLIFYNVYACLYSYYSVGGFCLFLLLFVFVVFFFIKNVVFVFFWVFCWLSFFFFLSFFSSFFWGGGRALFVCGFLVCVWFFICFLKCITIFPIGWLFLVVLFPCLCLLKGQSQLYGLSVGQ